VFNQRGSMFRRVPGRPASPLVLSGSSRANPAGRRGHVRAGSHRGMEALRVGSVLLVLVFLTSGVSGCKGWFRPVQWSELGQQQQQSQPRRESLLRVVPRQNRDVASLSPTDIVYVMQRVGFADEHIVDLGTDLHNALHLSGAAAIVYRKDAVALFRVNGGYLQIQTRSGSFDYDLARGRFATAPTSER